MSDNPEGVSPEKWQAAKQAAIDTMPCDCGQCIDAMLHGLRTAVRILLPGSGVVGEPTDGG